MKSPVLEARNEEIRERYWSLLSELGSSTATYEQLRKDYGLAQISLYQIVHHVDWYEKTKAPDARGYVAGLPVETQALP